MDYLELNKALNGFGKYVIQQSRSNLTKGKKNSTSDLYNSLKYDITEEQGIYLAAEQLPTLFKASWVISLVRKL